MGKMKIWYDEEGDYLEIGFGKKKGYMIVIPAKAGIQKDTGFRVKHGMTQFVLNVLLLMDLLVIRKQIAK